MVTLKIKNIKIDILSFMWVECLLLYHAIIKDCVYSTVTCGMISFRFIILLLHWHCFCD